MKEKGQAAEVLRVAGTMSGTSLDGVDIAVIETDGHKIHGFGETRYRPYSDTEREILRAALGKWPGEAGVDEAARIVEDAHIEVLADLDKVDLIGFHGQTLAHAPELARTHQAGSGEILADKLGIPVVWDFRTLDMRMGGQGAPLAPFYHWACAMHIGATDPVAFLNLGGVGNLTWIDPSKGRPDAKGALIAFDTGPANAPMDDLVFRKLGQRFDKDGQLAGQGALDQPVLNAFLKRPYFSKMPPKSLDRDAFSDLVDLVGVLSVEDAMATLAACAAGSVARGFEHLPQTPAFMLVGGGGRKNPILMEMIAALVDIPVLPVEEAGFDGDALEAQAFAHLAMRVRMALPTSAPGTTGVRAAIGSGQLAEPM